MHECRIYTGHPDQGGKLKKVVSAEKCRKKYWDDFNTLNQNGNDTRRKYKCQRCGKKFEAKSVNGAKYCAPCRLPAQIERLRVRKNAKFSAKGEMLCKICGKVIPADMPGQRRTCSEDCRKENRRRHRREQDARRRERLKEAKK